MMPATLHETTVLEPRDGVLVLRGYGLRVAVERGHLIVEDGVGRDRRIGRFAKVSPQLQRLVVVGTAGTLSLEALRWLYDTSVAFVQIDNQGRTLAASTASQPNDARVRRAQANAVHSLAGLSVARDLIQAKLRGQAEVLSRRLGAAEHAAALQDACHLVTGASTIERVRHIEARGAMAYWACWAGVTLRFPERERRQVPDHWLRFGGRRSALTNRNQHAINPANAVLNYLYGIAEVEARIAVLSAGCDPGMGVIHADRLGRDSFALDVLEAVRPAVDDFVLQLLQRETVTRDYFFEAQDGHCRLMPPLTERLSETGPRWAALLAPVARRTARLLERTGAAGGTDGRTTAQRRSRVSPLPLAPAPALPLLLRSHQATVAAARRTSPLPPGRPTVARLCRHCGAPFRTVSNVYCPACIALVPSLASAKAAEAAQERRAAGIKVSAETKRKLGSARSERLAAMRVWEARQNAVPASHVFTETIWPLLEDVPAQAIRQATGLSISYCRRILRGQHIPHPMHWELLEQLSKRPSNSD